MAHLSHCDMDYLLHFSARWLLFQGMMRSSVTCLRTQAYGSVEGDRTANTLNRGQHVLPSEQCPPHLLFVSQGTTYCQCLALLYRICRSQRLDGDKCAKFKLKCWKETQCSFPFKNLQTDRLIRI